MVKMRTLGSVGVGTSFVRLVYLQEGEMWAPMFAARRLPQSMQVEMGLHRPAEVPEAGRS